MTASAEILKGNILRQQGHLEEAAAAYQEAIRLEPQSVDAYQNLAEVLHELGSLDQAADAYQQAIALHPDDAPSPHPSKTVAPVESTEPPSSEPMQMESTAPASSELTQLEAFVDQQDWSNAIALGQQLVQKLPSALAFKLLGMALQFTGQFDSALDAYGNALDVKPDWAEVWANIGSVRAQQQQWDLAIECYERAIALKSDFAGAYRNLARVYEKMDQLQRAATCWYQAMLLAPDQSTAQDNLLLGDQLLLWNKVDWAINCFQLAVQKDPALAEAREQLDDALARQKQTQPQPDSSPESTSSPGADRPAPAMQPVAEASSPQVEPEPLSEAQKLELAKERLHACMTEQNWQGMIPYCQYILEHAPDSQTYRLLGNALQQLGNLDTAQRAYEAALEHEPDSAKTYANLGTLYAQQEQWDQAVQHFKQAIALQPDFAGAYRNLARAWEALEKTESATECWYQALRLEPQKLSAAEHVAFGDRFRRWAQVERAVECYQFALQQNPTLIKAQQNLAELLSQLGRWQEAVEQYQALTGSKSTLLSSRLARQEASSILKVMESLQRADLSNPQALLQLAELLPKAEKECLARAIAGYREWGNAARTEEDWETATSYYERVIQLDDKSAVDWGNLGTLYAQQKRWEEAVRCYEKAIALDGSRASFHWNLAQVLSKLERADEATEAYHQALILEPERVTPEQHCALGKVFMAQQNLEAASDCFERASHLDPQYMEARFYWAEALVKQNNATAAIEHYKYLVTVQPGNAQYWHCFGDALLKLGRYEDAVRVYEKAIALNPDFSWSHNNLGDALLKLERWQDAVKAYERAIALNPDFHWSYCNLGEALAQLEEWNSAIDMYKRALERKPDHLLSAEKLGDALQQRAKSDLLKASEYYQFSIQSNPKNIQTYHKALEICPGNTELYVGLGRALIEQCKFAEAIPFLEWAVEQGCQNPQCFLLLTEALANQKSWEEVVKHLERAIDLGLKNSWQVYLSLGDALTHLGRYDQAEAILKHALTLNSNSLVKSKLEEALKKKLG